MLSTESMSREDRSRTVALAKVIGNSPILFTNKNGNQIALPLSWFQFNNSVVEFVDPANKAILSPDGLATLTGMLAQLAQSGAIVPDATPPPKPAVVFTAKNPGSTGNDIQIS